MEHTQWLTPHIILIYLFAMVLFSYGMLKILKLDRFWAFLLLFLFNTLMVGVGPVMTLFLYFYRRRAKEIPLDLKANILDMEQLLLSYPIVKRSYGEGPLEKLLENEKIPEERKVKILAYLTSQLNREDIRLIHSTLSSKSDESRLLCFGVLNQMEKQLNDQIGTLLQKCEQTQQKEKIATYQQEVAHLYWEFIYYQLVSKDLEDFYIQNAKEFANKALPNLKDKAKLYLLLGKIHLHLKKYQEALPFFNQAAKSPLLREGTLPYLAQLHFEQKDFIALKAIVEEIKTDNYTPKTLAFSSLWRDDRCTLTPS